MKLLDLVKKGESKTLEFKEFLPKNESIAKTVVAFANTAGGKLIIGVNDNCEVIGFDDTALFEVQDKIASIIADSCFPMIIPEIYSVNIEGKLVLVIEVVRGSLKPYFLKQKGKSDGTYIRLGATNRAADAINIAELERQKLHIGFDEEICYETKLSELDLTPLYEKFKSIGKPLNNEKLTNLKLIKTDRGNDYPTNALMIILGRFSHCVVNCARFRGKTMSVFLDKKEYQGDIFSVLENVQNFVLNHINLRGEIEGLQRTDTYEIPVPALREALINALIHRDYTKQGKDIKVGVFDHNITVLSPGGLPYNMTIEDVFNGRSEARNRIVAHVFKELRLIEQWGSGINRIIDHCKEHGLRTPGVSEKNDFFEVQIIRQEINNTELMVREPEPEKHQQKRPITAKSDRLPQKATDYDEKRPIMTKSDRMRRKATDYDEKRPITDRSNNLPQQKINDCERLRTITNDYERLRTITND